MSRDKIRKIARRIINREKWWDILSRFIDVLRINLFIVDHEGAVLLPPEEGRYGGRLLTDRRLGFDLLDDAIDFHKQFIPHGPFWEARNRFGLKCFAIPVEVDGQTAVAYMIAGPVAMTRMPEDGVIEEWAKEYKADKDMLRNELAGVRVLSNVMMDSILDLLFEIIRNNVELSLKTEDFPAPLAEAIYDIDAAVRMDELLVTFLDTALKMTETEGGSVMVLDSTADYLTVRASRGLNVNTVDLPPVKVGQGVAGLAVKADEVFLLHGNEDRGDKRLQGLLTRPQIRTSVSMPIKVRDRVFGVLNLHTTQEQDRITDNLENLKHISKLFASAF